MGSWTSMYFGPKGQIQPDKLDQVERSGQYVAEEKHDGFWAEVSTDPEGKIYKIVGRSGKEFVSTHVAGLLGLNLGVASSTFVAELESGTEFANRVRVEKRRLWVFDVTRLLNRDTRGLPYEQRRSLLEMALAKAQRPTAPRRRAGGDRCVA